MVFGYVMCLIAPNLTADTNRQVGITNSIVVQFIATENQITPPTYQVHFSDSQTAAFTLDQNLIKAAIAPNKKAEPLNNYIPELSDGLAFKQFTRPPPFSC